VIEVAARPSPVGVDPLRTAVVVIDMQNDFGARGGMFDRAGIDIAGIRAAIEPTRRLTAAARQAGIPIVYLKMEHPEDLSNVGPVDGPHWIKHRPFGLGDEVAAPDGAPSRTLVEGTWSTEIVDELRPQPGDIVVSKHRYSGFFETTLHDELRRLGASYLLIAGCTTSVCVESTVRDAMFRDYVCVVLEDCTAEPLGAGLLRSNHEASLLTIETFGWVATSEAVVGALTAGTAVATAG
jgi:ureidoacrylate peracid hydrolase